MASRALARQLAAASIEAGKPLDWFEALYQQADGDPSSIPWADMSVNPNLTDWLQGREIVGANRKALVIGCGLGDDAEALAELGFQVVAFDISAACVSWCRQRFPQSKVEYLVADILSPPSAWTQSFDFVLEIYTLQVLPPDLRIEAVKQIVGVLAPHGNLLAISRGRGESDAPGSMPWPLLKSELREFVTHGLKQIEFDDYIDSEEPPVRRFRALFQNVPR